MPGSPYSLHSDSAAESPVIATAVRRRRHVTRRAAIALLAGVTAFAVLQVAAILTFEVLNPGAIDPTYGDVRRRIGNALRSDPVRPRLVIALGSSHVQNGLADEAMSATLGRNLGRPVSVINAAFAACGPRTELFTWRRLLRDGVRPELLLVEACAGAITDAGAVHETSALQMPAGHLGLRDLPLLDRSWLDARPGLWSDVALGECNALYRFRPEIIRAILPAVLPVPKPLADAPARQWPIGAFLIPPECVSTEQRRKARECAHGEYVGALSRCNPEGPSGQALCALLASCHEARIPVAVLLMPEGPEFRSWYPPGTRTMFDAWLNGMSWEFGARLVDARDWMAEDDFVDSHHLMAPGAGRFSERLGREHVLPLLLTRP